jgi:integrase
MRGHVRKRGRKWAVVLDVGRDPLTGKRKREWHSGYNTRREAEDARIRLLAAAQRGEHVEPSKLTLGEFLEDKWLPARQASLAPSTSESYSRNVRVHIKPKLGSARLQGLTPDALNAFYADRLRVGRRDGKGLSPRMVRYLHSIIHKALADALRWGYVVRNVADAAEPPSPSAAKAKPPKTWSALELRRFLEHVREDRLYALWLLYGTTGLRRGEALGSHWPDVDLEAGYMSMVEASTSVAYRVTPSRGKTERSRRRVALDPATVAALRAHRKRQATERLAFGPAYQDHGLVFCREDGTPIHPERVSGMFAAHVEVAGLPRIPLKNLRHTWASLALQADVHPKVVSERLGHATVSFTLDTYSHVMPGLQEDAAATVAELVLGA